MSSFRAALRFGLVSVFSLALWACGKQGIGERCDPANGDSDCDTGLECLTSNDLADIPPGSGLCCPPGGGGNNCDVNRSPSFDASPPDDVTVPPLDAATGTDSGGTMPDSSPGAGGSQDAAVSDAATD